MDRWLLKYVAMTIAAVIGVFAYEVVPWRRVESSTWAYWVQAIGSVGAILAAIWVMNRQNDATAARDLSASHSETANILRAMAAEIDSHLYRIEQIYLADRYGIIPNISWNFHIYAACAGSIGKIPGSELQAEIVNFYSGLDNFYQISNHRTDALERLKAGPETRLLIEEATAKHEAFRAYGLRIHEGGPVVTGRIRAAAETLAVSA